MVLDLESFYLNSWFPPEDSSGGFGEDYPREITEYEKVCQTCTEVDSPGGEFPVPLDALLLTEEGAKHLWLGGDTGLVNDITTNFSPRGQRAAHGALGLSARWRRACVGC